MRSIIRSGCRRSAISCGPVRASSSPSTIRPSRRSARSAASPSKACWRSSPKPACARRTCSSSAPTRCIASSRATSWRRSSGRNWSTASASGCSATTPRTPRNLVYFGTTEHGYDVELSRHAVDADLCVYINAGLHLGFSGGWKSVAVGLSTWRSIRHTHHPGRHVDVRAQQPHARRAERDGRAPRSIDGQAHLQDRMRAGEPDEDRARLGGRRHARRARRRSK